ncbi:MAG TPA: hypothetical protein VKV36_06670 [Acidimicrobiales bacterium]|nr:hypothetical protein [Acidimicrobiales bacterium]
MAASDDLDTGMARFTLDPTLVERLLGGALHPDDAPPGLGHVAELVRAARGPATSAEHVGREAAMSAFAAMKDGSGVPAPTARRQSMLGKFMTLKVLAAAGPIALAGAGAAAATGSLPAPAQSAVSHVLADVGISVPNPDTGHSGTSDSVNGTSHAQGPDASATSPATFGLCTAFTSGGLDSHSVAYANLSKAAGGDSAIQSYCQGIISAHQSGVGSKTDTTDSTDAPHGNTDTTGSPHTSGSGTENDTASGTGDQTSTSGTENDTASGPGDHTSADQVLSGAGSSPHGRP